MRKFSQLACIILFSLPAFAAGGTCPSGANYLNSSGSLVTLSTLGVTSCYYVSKSAGSDSNAGTTEASPWAHLPGMPSCTSNCAANTPTGGVGYILRGGDTWVGSDLGVHWQWDGTSASAPIYVGVDPTWFSGSSWARPIWSCASTAPGCSSSGPQGGSVIWFVNNNYVTLDDIEATGFQTAGGVEDTLFYTYSGILNYERLYIHGWSHSTSGDSDNSNVFGGGNGGPISGTCVHDSVIDGSDTTGDMLAAFLGDMPCAYDNIVKDVTNGFEGTFNIAFNNLVGPINNCFTPGGCHQNAMYNFAAESGSTILIYDNIITGNTCPVCGGVIKLWLAGNGAFPGTGYVFNNVIYNNTDGGGNFVALGGHDAINYGTWDFFNNTVECGTDASLATGCADNLGGTNGMTLTFNAYNNHWINATGSGAVTCSFGITCNNTTDLTQTLTTAKGQGYTSSSVYALQPASGSGGTVGSGTNEQSLCTAIGSATIGGFSSSYATAAATACKNDTGYACSYNTGNHTVTCPDRTELPRPASGAWDIGAYQSSSSQVQAPPPPTNLKYTLQ